MVKLLGFHQLWLRTKHRRRFSIGAYLIARYVFLRAWSLHCYDEAAGLDT